MADCNNGESLVPFPRAELHYHLEGGIRIERLVELGKKKAAKLGIDVSNVTEDEWKQKYQLDRSGDTSANSLTTFIEKVCLLLLSTHVMSIYLSNAIIY